MFAASNVLRGDVGRAGPDAFDRIRASSDRSKGGNHPSSLLPGNPRIRHRPGDFLTAPRPGLLATTGIEASAARRAHPGRITLRGLPCFFIAAQCDRPVFVVQESLEQEIRAYCNDENWERAMTVATRGYGPEVLGYLIAVADRETDATEAFSLFCERVWRGLPTFRWEASFRTWAYVIARNELRRHLAGERRRGARERPLAEVPAVEQVVDHVRSQTAAFLRTAVKDKFSALRSELSQLDRDVLVLRVDRGLSWNEVVEILSESTASDGSALTSAGLRKRLERVKKQLRTRAIEQGLLDEDGNVLV